MSKDHHDDNLQESLQKHEQHQEEEEEEDDQGIENDEEEEEAVASRKDVEEEEGEAVQSRKEVEEECKTPTSSDHKIPTIQSCPPTPRKKVRLSSSHKRKLSELQFFETSRSEEVESFFRSNSEPFTANSSRIKRRCRSA